MEIKSANTWCSPLHGDGHKENLNSLMRSKASRNAKLTVWGQLMALEEIYAEGFKRDDSFAYSLRSKLYPYSDHMRRAFVWLHIDPLIDAIPLEELRELTAGHELILAHQRREDL